MAAFGVRQSPRNQPAVGNIMTEASHRESVPRLCLWLLRYARGRWAAFLMVLATMLFGVGLDVLRPWPMKLLVDYALDQEPIPGNVQLVLRSLPGGLTRDGLIAWSVVST